MMVSDTTPEAMRVRVLGVDTVRYSPPWTATRQPSSSGRSSATTTPGTPTTSRRSSPFTLRAWSSRTTRPGERVDGDESARTSRGSSRTGPTWRFEDAGCYARDGLVVSEWTATATRRDGRRLEWDGIDVFPFRERPDPAQGRLLVLAPSARPRLRLARCPLRAATRSSSAIPVAAEIEQRARGTTSSSSPTRRVGANGVVAHTGAS